jgi:hypothetical protein
MSIQKNWIFFTIEAPFDNQIIQKLERETARFIKSSGFWDPIFGY